MSDQRNLRREGPGSSDFGGDKSPEPEPRANPLPDEIEPENQPKIGQVPYQDPECVSARKGALIEARDLVKDAQDLVSAFREDARLNRTEGFSEAYIASWMIAVMQGCLTAVEDAQKLTAARPGIEDVIEIHDDLADTALDLRVLVATLQEILDRLRRLPGSRVAMSPGEAISWADCIIGQATEMLDRADADPDDMDVEDFIHDAVGPMGLARLVIAMFSPEEK